MFKKILVANRGEIAIRVARACRELGISTVGVFSTADQSSLHLRYMDDAVWIGDSPPLASYLNIERLTDVARQKNVDAIHPGYGFLAENSQFAKACENAGLAFIGPDSKALALVGDKVASRNTVKKVGVPIIPGMEVVSADISVFKQKAKEVGYPVIVKASMGGGGKGMRIVKNEAELEASITAGQREAQSAFGDATVYLEKYISTPRHIEFQVLRDTQGNVVHLCERECSVQRRHQKIIEETPSPALDAELRERMGEAAKKVIAAAHYTNAGTVEFLLDEKRNYYFLEVNARIQVEHPITEMVIGVDLVRQQILIAAGECIAFEQSMVTQRGHSIEARIYAEDPECNFMPSPGKILFLREPSGPGVRVDSGICSDWIVPPHYDPILSKLITWAETRKTSIKRLRNALRDYAILGIKTNIAFLGRIMETPAFADGSYHTHFIDENEKSLLPRHTELSQALIIGGLVSSRKGMRDRIGSDRVGYQATTPWQEMGAWELGSN